MAWHDGQPSFPRLGERILVGASGIVTYLVFDVLRIDGEDAMCLPYADRAELLRGFRLSGSAGHTSHGTALCGTGSREGRPVKTSAL